MSNKVAVFGPSGMLGRQVVKALHEAGYTPQPVYRRMFDLLNKTSIDRVIEGCSSVINCAGMIPIKNTSTVDMIRINSEFPHVLAQCEVPTILVSTDCVFSGRSNNAYQVTSIKDPRDYYGMSKSLGEVLAPHIACVRTSFIGCEHGFMNWILSAGYIAKSLGSQQRIDGWKNAMWSGSTVVEVARSLVDMLPATDKPMPTGIVHLSTEQVINKFDLALRIVEMHDLNVEVVPTYQPTLNRALVPTVPLPPLDQALADYVCKSR